MNVYGSGKRVLCFFSRKIFPPFTTTSSAPIPDRGWIPDRWSNQRLRNSCQDARGPRRLPIFRKTREQPVIRRKGLDTIDTLVCPTRRMELTIIHHGCAVNRWWRIPYYRDDRSSRGNNSARDGERESHISDLITLTEKLIDVCRRSNVILRKAVRLKKEQALLTLHSLNTAILAIKMGIVRSFSRERLFSLAVSALLGDIGMTG